MALDMEGIVDICEYHDGRTQIVAVLPAAVTWYCAEEAIDRQLDSYSGNLLSCTVG